MALSSPPSIAAGAMEKSELQQRQQRKRVVVCGGGVIGICTAFFLAKKAGASVAITVVEKSSIACAASGKAGGFLALDWCDRGLLSHLARASFNLHRSLAADLDGPNSYGYRPLRTLSLSIDASSATSSSQNPASLPSWIDGAVRRASTIGTVETTAQVHPQLFTRTLFASSGADLVTGEVERVEAEGGRARAVVIRKEGGERSVLEADAVVLALGPWSCRMVLISSLFQVSGLKAHSIVLKPKNPGATTPDALFINYFPSPGGKALEPEVYPRPTGEVYVCGMSADAEVPDDPEQIVGDPQSIRMLHKMAGAVSSHLGEEGGVEVRAEQACFLPYTDDGLPVIGEIPDVKGCYVATGHSCWGILNGPATGAAVAELVLDGHASIVDLTPFSPARFLRSSRRM